MTIHGVSLLNIETPNSEDGLVTVVTAVNSKPSKTLMCYVCIVPYTVTYYVKLVITNEILIARHMY